jgi:arylsulfatase A-like enzyme
MNRPTSSIAAALLTIACCVAAVVVNAEQGDAPNILLIVADDLGFSDLGCYGGEIETPNLDRLADGGLRLTQFYTTGRCCPSRAGLLTGLYPHRVGLGHMTQDIDQPGYRGRLAEGVMTIGDQLSRAGYRTFLSGKWHLGTDDPTRHGFEEFYGTLTSAKTFWDPSHYRRLPEGRQARKYDEAEFYGTDALADHAIDFLGQAHQTPEKPWFLYLAFNAPHFPLQARPRTIAKYAGRYTEGWDVARERRLARMKRLGVIPHTTSLTPRSPYYHWAAAQSAPNPAWDSLSKDRQADLARRMAIYAAMVDSMDQNVGRILSDLDSRGELDNTLIVFTSDNGACAEWDMYGFDGKSGPNNTLHRGKEIVTMGSHGTFHSAGSGWANTSNAPWRLYKHYNHEGGIAVPCIVHWPARMKTGQPSRGGHIDATPTHLIDILPTFLDAAGQPSLKHSASRLQGQSLLPLLADEALQQRKLFFEHEGNRAVRSGRWKLVALRGQPWELYDMDSDRTELSDLASKRLNLVKRLSASWNTWATDNHVTPLPRDYHVPYVPVGD